MQATANSAAVVLALEIPRIIKRLVTAAVILNKTTSVKVSGHVYEHILGIYWRAFFSAFVFPPLGWRGEFLLHDGPIYTDKMEIKLRK